MSLSEVVVEGTLKPDGTLELDRKPNLPPGRVQVIVQAIPELPAGDPFWNAPFGAAVPLTELPDAAAVTAFFAEGRTRGQ